MSLFSGFSTAGDEERAIRLSRLMTEKTHLLMARVVNMHRASNPLVGVDGEVYRREVDGEPVRLCVECLKPWPCPTWRTLTGEEEL